ncbi:MAG TPA: hypothetical protein DHW82_01565 [Spirochaetia bacterium]|nr:MAG: hypothetical protein A2Y41_01815 [Spirochaetes bacterium GWB1_36_13]HCL55684.1 hypothetical protein [Spirochaetia bacterium]
MKIKWIFFLSLLFSTSVLFSEAIQIEFILGKVYKKDKNEWKILSKKDVLKENDILKIESKSLITLLIGEKRIKISENRFLSIQELMTHLENPELYLKALESKDKIFHKISSQYQIAQSAGVRAENLNQEEDGWIENENEAASKNESMILETSKSMFAESNYQEVISFLESKLDYIRIPENKIQIVILLSYSYFQTGNYDSALLYLLYLKKEENLNNNQRKEVLSVLLCAYFSKNDFQNALSLFESSKDFKNEPDLLFMAAVSADKTGDRKKALYYYEEILKIQVKGSFADMVREEIKKLEN